MRRHATTMVTGLFVTIAVCVGALAQAQPTTTRSDAGAPAASGSATSAAAGDAGTAGVATGAPSGSATSAGSATPTPVGSGAPTTTPGGMDGQTYAVRLRNLQEQVDQLKDQIRRSHTRLALLSDTIIGGGGAGSRAEVSFQNEMSSAFRLTRALFVLDGQVQYQRADDTGALADQKMIPIFSGSIPPGDHTISVLLNFQGNGYGVFTYLRGYKFEVKSSHSFTSVEGKALEIQATALEKGGVTTPLEQRPAIEWHEKVGALAPGAPAAAAGGGKP